MIWNKTLTTRDLLNISQARKDRAKDLKSVKFIARYVTIVNRPTTGFLRKIISLFKNPVTMSLVYKFEVRSNSGKTYKILIDAPNDLSMESFLKAKLKVFCECADFKYRSAYGLNKTNNLYLNKATKDHLGIAITDEPTKITPTPSCKHIYATVNYFYANFNSINK